MAYNDEKKTGMSDDHKVWTVVVLCATTLLIVITVCITYYNVVDRKEPGRVFTGQTSFTVK